MTSREYDLSRLEALPLAVKKIEAVRLIVSTTNAPAWHKLYRAGEALKTQLSAEFSAYFKEVPDPEPPAGYPAPKNHQPTNHWYSDPATIARCVQQTDAQRIAGVISDHGIAATVRPTPGGSYSVEVAQRDEARANRAVALAEQEAQKS